MPFLKSLFGAVKKKLTPKKEPVLSSTIDPKALAAAKEKSTRLQAETLTAAKEKSTRLQAEQRIQAPEKGLPTTAKTPAGEAPREPGQVWTYQGKKYYSEEDVNAAIRSKTIKELPEQVERTLSPQTGQAAPITDDDIINAATFFGGGLFIQGGKLVAGKGITTSGNAAAGKLGLEQIVSGKTGKIIINTKTEKLVNTYIGKILKELKKPKFVLTAVTSIVGAMIMGNFFKEEALQVIGWGVEDAIDMRDADLAEEAQDRMDEILDPGMWGKLLDGLPTVIVTGILDFFGAARAKGKINREKIEDIKLGTTPQDERDAYYQAVEAERREWEETRNRIYQENEAKKQEAIEARDKQQRIYYEKLQDEADARAAEEKKYWTEWNKEKDRQQKAWEKARLDNMKSNLKFGLL